MRDRVRGMEQSGFEHTQKQTRSVELADVLHEPRADEDHRPTKDERWNHTAGMKLFQD
jgi:hypothetical protein